MSQSADYEHATQNILNVFRAFRKYSKQVNSSGVTGRQVSCLRFLIQHGPATVSDIASYLFVGTSSASELVDKLQTSHHVTRRRSAEDNRKVYVELTEKGTDAAENIPLGGLPLLRERMATLDESSIENINRAFSDIAALIGLNDTDSTS